MKKIVILISFIFLPLFLFSQSDSKIKGSKIVELKTKKVEPFKGIDISDEFTVVLTPKLSPGVIIDADENLHQYIDIKVTDSILKISTNKVFTRFKRLFIEIGYTNQLSDIILKEKVKLKTKSTLNSEKLNIETYGNANAEINYKSNSANFFAKEKSKITLNGESDILNIKLNDNAEIKATATVKNFTSAQSLKSKLTINGKATQSIIMLSDNSYLNSANFIVGTTNFTNSNSADAYIYASDKLIIEVSGKTHTYLLGDPLVELKVFKDEATIHKVNKAPNALKSFLK